jgi:Rieske Fe-S protein
VSQDPDGPVTTTAAVPVGGGVILPEHDLVVTQPAAGRFAAFSATCPHAGCTVRAVVAGTINCFCHGSRFRIADGSVAGGPSQEPLHRKDIHVSGNEIRLL